MNFMKLKLYTSAAVITVFALVSCAGNDSKDYVDKSVVPTTEEKATTAQNVIANPTIQNTAAMPANLQQQGTPVTVPVTNPVIVSPQQPQQLNMSSQNNVVMTRVQTPVQPTAAGMNPAHGQPGHRCDISVGAPLNSKPAPAPATTAATNVSAQPQVTMKEVPTTTKTAPGMNPPHGEPNHRCDIAVGAPLNSKPTTPTTVTTTSAPASIAPPPLLTAPKNDSSKN